MAQLFIHDVIEILNTHIYLLSNLFAVQTWEEKKLHFLLRLKNKFKLMISSETNPVHPLVFFFPISDRFCLLVTLFQGTPKSVANTHKCCDTLPPRK
jgi:hypothetical protein